MTLERKEELRAIGRKAKAELEIMAARWADEARSRLLVPEGVEEAAEIAIGMWAETPGALEVFREEARLKDQEKALAIYTLAVEIIRKERS